MLAKKTLLKTDWHSVIFLCLQVTKRVGGHSSVQAFQQTAGICSDETSARVSSQARYVCANLPLCVPVSRLSSRGIIPKKNQTMFSSSYRHPRLPHDHSDCHVSGIPLRRIWRVYFLHPRRIQRRSQSLPRPLTCKLVWSKQEMTSELMSCLGGGKEKTCCFYSHVHLKRKKRELI